MTSTGMPCPSCNHINAPEMRFCVACGTALPRLCPSCGHPVPEAHRFCGHCGASLEPPLACSQCGQPVPLGHRFCGHCGAPVAPEPPAPSGTSTPAPSPPEAVEPVPASELPASSPGNGHFLTLSERHEEMLRGLRGLMPPTLAEKIRESAGEIRGQRREVTVLFLQLSEHPVEEATSLDLDQETVYWILDQAMRRLVEVIYKYEGTVDKFMGNGLMALFGAPVTHEDDPQRAVRTAQEIHQTLELLSDQLAPEHGLRLKARIGINTGEVVAGRVGNSLHMEYTVIGDTVNLAARLQDAAQPGTTLVSLVTYRYTRRTFHFAALAPIQVKGKPEPVRTFRVLAVREGPGQVRGLPGLEIPMVGRRDKLALLEAALENTLRTGRSHYALISGEAGLGKSRLVQEFLAQIQGRPINVHVAACLAYARSTPYFVLGALIRQLAQIAEGEPAHVQQRQVEKYLDEVGLPSAELMPYLLVTMGQEGPHGDIAERMANLTAEVLQRQIFRAVAQVLRAEAQVAPTVLVLEDIHWLDPASRAFFTEFLEISSDLPMLTILVSREYERSTVARPLLAVLVDRDERFTDIRLDALSEEEARQLVICLLERAGLERPGLADRIVQRAEGNPFYIEEIVRMLLEKAEFGPAEERTNGLQGAVVDPGTQVEETLRAVPGNLRGLILARFDALPEASKAIVQRAAVLGRSFPVELLQRLTSLSLEELTQHLDELVQRQFLVREPFSNGLGYAFRHILILEAIYGTLLKRDRRELHYQVALVLEHEPFLPKDNQIEALAYHYLQSHHPERARPYLLQAAQRSMQRSAYESAVQLFEQLFMFYEQEPEDFDPVYVQTLVGMGQALKLSGSYEEALVHLSTVSAYLDRYPIGPETASEQVDLYLEARCELGDVLQRRGDFLTATEHLDEALAVAQKHRRTGSPIWFTLVERKAWVDFRRGNLDSATRLAREAIQALEAMERPGLPPIVLANLYNTLGGAAWQQGNLHEAISYVRGSLHIHEQAGYAWGMSVAYTNLGNLYWSMGQWTAATEAYARAAQIQADNGFMAEQTISLRNLGHILIFQGKYDEARQALLQTLTLCEAQDNRYGLLLSHLALAALAAEQDDREELAYQLEQARKYADLADLQHQVEMTMYTGRLCQLDGRYAEAEPLLLEARQKAEEANLQEVLIEGEYALGLLYGAQGRLATAEYCLQRSAELAGERGNTERQAKALMELAHLLFRHSRSGDQDPQILLEKATVLLDKATHLFQEARIEHRLAQCQELRGAIQRASQRLAQLSEGGPTYPLDLMDGHGLAESRRVPVTVAWLDLRVAAEEPDEEWAFEELTTLLSLAHTVIQELGGHLVRQTQGVLLVFGVPAVREDDVPQAAEAALRILEELAQPERFRVYQVAAGLSSGPAICTTWEPDHHERLVVSGPSVDQARELAQQAPAGQLWVTQAAADRMRHAFVLAPIAAKAEDRDTRIYRVSARQARPGSPRGLERGVRMVGREELLEAMLEFTRTVRQGRGGVLWVEGDAGIGKSRLLREYAARLAQEGTVFWTGACSARSRSQAFFLFTQIFASAFDFTPGDSLETRRAKLHSRVEALGLDVGSMRPYLDLLCGLPLGMEEIRRLERLAPEQLRQQIFTAARAALGGQVAQGPLVLLIDDLHWVDPVSANLLLSLASLILSAPVLFVLATRPGIDEDGPEEVQLLRQRFADFSLFLDVTQLSPEESLDLLQALLGEEPVDTELAQFVLARSQGNPYFVEEFVRFLMERDLLHRTEQGWALATPPEQVMDTWPTSLEALIRSRLDVLPAVQRQLVQYAAVLARPFKATLMTRLLQRPQIEEVLASLVRRKVLRYQVEGRHWYFGHHLTQMVVYSGLLRVHRQALHLDIAQTLEEMAQEGNTPPVLEELAHHFQEAGYMAKALDYWVQAGEEAMGQYAVEAALDHFERAYAIIQQEILQVSTDLRRRVAMGLAEAYRYRGKLEKAAQILQQALEVLPAAELSPAQRAGLYRLLGDIVRRQGQPEKAYDAFRQALVLLEEPETQEGQAEAARALQGLAFTHFQRGQLDKAFQVAQLGLEYARRAQEPIIEAGSENLLGGIAYAQGNWQETIAHVDRAYQLYEAENDLNGMAAALSNLAILMAEQGDRDRARLYFRHSLELREKIGDLEGVALTHNNLGWLERLSGHFERARSHFERGRSLSESLRFPFHLATALLALGELHLAQGQQAEAQAFLDQATRWAQEADAQALLAEIHQIQAQAALALDDPSQAEQSARWAILLAAETGNSNLEAGAWRILSQIQLHQGKLEAAERSLNMAQQRLTEPRGLEAGRILVQSARLHMARQEAAEARQMLERARELFQHLGTRPDLEDVEALLVQLA